MESDKARIEKDIETLASHSSPSGRGITRLTFSSDYQSAVNYLIDRMEAIGLRIGVTEYGNISGRLPGFFDDQPPILVGSHIDSVPNGGKFDGAAGVISALEATRVLYQAHGSLTHPVEVVIFAEEEGARFGQLLTGSRASAGYLSRSDLQALTDRDGTGYLEAREALDFEKLAPTSEFGSRDSLAMLEVHIEQGRKLETSRVPLGIVQRIAGLRQWKVQLTGVANHAGSTDMQHRYDALAAASDVITKTEQLVNEEFPDNAVATVGAIECNPGAANVIPEYVEFVIDFRSVHKDVLDELERRIMRIIKRVTEMRKLSFQINLLNSEDPISLTLQIRTLLEKAAKACDIPYIQLDSGAIHDAAVMASVTNAGMLFVPSENGLSHCPQEHTDTDDIKLATDMLAEAIVQLDRDKG